MNTSNIEKISDRFGLVISNQSDVHPHLEKHLRRHLNSSWLQPFHLPSVEVFDQLFASGLLSEQRAVVLDSGCGTGKSTHKLAEMYPDHLVVGIDQSLSRLSKSGAGSGIFQKGNLVLLRAELSTFWRLLLEHNIYPGRHYLLYPNPWPKSAHLQRRWHAHPVFPTILALGGQIELRCNWDIYAREFASAVNIATGSNIRASVFTPETGISRFEQKYLQRKQKLYRVVVPASCNEPDRGSNGEL